jgi:AmmeMemoRadiSam system protein B/AmmeMemoRadiSam system protein A
MVIFTRGCMKKTVAFMLVLCTLCFAQSREAKFAGSFYPADAGELNSFVSSCISSAPARKDAASVLGIIVPHAGYQYSGRIAAYAYSLLKGRKNPVVFLIGTSHHARFSGALTDDRKQWKTPLGTVPVEMSIVKELLRSPCFRTDARILDVEHALEVQLPFLQKVLGTFRIVPILVGTDESASLKDVASVITGIAKKETSSVFVISTDLSHYYSLSTAQKKDGMLLDLLVNGRISDIEDEMHKGNVEMCGSGGVFLGMEILRALGGTKVRLLRYGTSFDATGDSSRVVGYAAVGIFRDSAEKGVHMLNEKQRKALLKLARESIECYLQGKNPPVLKEQDPIFRQKRGVFVTLRKKGSLRGCIGLIVSREELASGVREMAVQSATGDPRFPPVTLDELKDITIEISVLTEPKRVASPDDIQIGRDGVIVKRGSRQGVFLPQVADETGWTKEEFLSNLCAHKAFLSPDAWKDPSTELYTFQAEVFSEPE